MGNFISTHGHILGWTLVGLGGILAIIGGVLLAMHKSRWAAIGLLIGGLVLLIPGVIILLLHYFREQKPK